MKTTIIIENHDLETLEKQFNEVYYSTFAKENSNLSEAQINGYRFIAEQCPLLNADVVYRSRAVMRLFDDTTFYDDAMICYEAGLEYKMAKAEKPIPASDMICTLSPNPTAGNAKLNFNKVPDVEIRISISDIQNRILFEKSTFLEKEEFLLPTENYPSGIFLVRVIQGKMNIFNGKLIINK